MADPLPALFRRYPGLEGRIPWIPLGTFPTPIETVRIDTTEGPLRILVKRDDRTAALYGGNKVRKLEFLLAEAERRGSRRLITAGAAGSHHALATTIYGRRHGFEVSVVLFPQPPAPHVADILRMDAEFGADVWWVRRMELVPLGIFRARLRHREDRAFVMAPGGSDATGTLGYVSAGLEIAEQIRGGQASRPSRVFVAAGTMGTAAGLALGFAMAGLEVPIIATRITGRIVANERVLRSLVQGAISKLHEGGIRLPEVDDVLRLVTLSHDQIGKGYGQETEASRNALALFGKAGLQLDTTYTAKAAAELTAWVTNPAAADEAPPLFLQSLSESRPLGQSAGKAPSALPAAVQAYLAEVESRSPH
jgi:1-aminocyclopropane-1-carboxylate deaminase/D-cysteine desulfhydrase-like pyridoxal-dependent ACC family enzyme